jgi:hypothetical protein
MRAAGRGQRQPVWLLKQMQLGRGACMHGKGGGSERAAASSADTVGGGGARGGRPAGDSGEGFGRGARRVGGEGLG